MQEVYEDDCFAQRCDALGIPWLSTVQKCISANRMLLSLATHR